MSQEYLLLGGRVDKYRTMYEKAIEVVKKSLIFRPMLPKGEDILMSGTLSVLPPKEKQPSETELDGESAHLTCFAGGMFGLGAKIYDRKDDLEIAKKLTEGCVWAYSSTSTGIMPESFSFIPCENQNECAWNKTKYWNTLDPNAEDRMLAYKRQMETYKEQMAAASSDYEAALAAMKTPPPEAAPELPEPSATPTPAHEHLQKRQLDVEPPNVPFKPGTPSDDEDETLTKVHEDNRDDESLHTPTVPAFPVIYSPKPPLPHEEYVKNRIQEERLPPGSISVRSRHYILR